VWAILLEEVTFRRDTRPGDFWRLLGYAVVEAFGYRQLTVWFRLQSFWKYARGERAWGNMMREGFHSTKRRLTPFRSLAAVTGKSDGGVREQGREQGREPGREQVGAQVGAQVREQVGGATHEREAA
jgi:hypothetical protein